MNIKNWAIFFLPTVFTLYLITVLLHFLVDPLQLFNNSITKNKFALTKQYSKIQFNLLMKDEYTLVFGSSRNARLSSNMLGENVLNFNNLYTEPGEIYNFLKQLNTLQIQNIKNIYFLFDVHTFREETEKEFINYVKYDLKQELFNIFVINENKIQAFKNDIVYNYIKQPDYYIHKDGSSIPYTEKTTYQTSAVFNSEERQKYSISALQTMIKINQFALDNKINIIYFTPTFMDLMFSKIDLSLEMKKFAYLLNNGISSIYVLLYLDGISNLKEGNHYFAFSDAAHLNAKFLKKSFFDYVINEKEPSLHITNLKSLNSYFNELKQIQSKLN